jgi:hypothetical protein
MTDTATEPTLPDELRGITLWKPYDEVLVLACEAADLIERLARERDKAINALSTLVYRYDCEHEGEKPILAPSAIQTARAIIKRHAARQAKPKENADG